MCMKRDNLMRRRSRALHLFSNIRFQAAYSVH